MSGLQELKATYEEIKNSYGYFCSNISITEEDEDTFYKLTFDYQGFGDKMSFSYGFSNAPYTELDEISFDCDETIFYAACYFAISDFCSAINKNRLDKDIMKEFMKYLYEEIQDKE